MKTKYISRRKGKGGKWEYKYTKSEDTEKYESQTERFDLKPTNTVKDMKENIDKILSGYSNREMATIQVFTYIKEHNNIAKSYLKELGISSSEEYKKYLSKVQTKLRSGKGTELKSKRQAIETERALRSLNEIEKMALNVEKGIMTKTIDPWRIALLKMDNRRIYNAPI